MQLVRSAIHVGASLGPHLFPPQHCWVMLAARQAVEGCPSGRDFTPGGPDFIIFGREASMSLNVFTGKVPGILCPEDCAGSFRTIAGIVPKR